jgi:hypothetical protein
MSTITPSAESRISVPATAQPPNEPPTSTPTKRTPSTPSTPKNENNFTPPPTPPKHPAPPPEKIKSLDERLATTEPVTDLKKFKPGGKWVEVSGTGMRCYLSTTVHEDAGEKPERVIIST